MVLSIIKSCIRGVAIGIPIGLTVGVARLRWSNDGETVARKKELIPVKNPYLE
jgi:hypothetical protein